MKLFNYIVIINLYTNIFNIHYCFGSNLEKFDIKKITDTITNLNQTIKKKIEKLNQKIEEIKENNKNIDKKITELKEKEIAQINNIDSINNLKNEIETLILKKNQIIDEKNIILNNPINEKKENLPENEDKTIFSKTNEIINTINSITSNEITKIQNKSNFKNEIEEIKNEIQSILNTYNTNSI
jgi:hypothetical protein